MKGTVSTPETAIGKRRVRFVTAQDHDLVDEWVEPDFVPLVGDFVALSHSDDVPEGYWYEVVGRRLRLSYLVECHVQTLLMRATS